MHAQVKYLGHIALTVSLAINQYSGYFHYLPALARVHCTHKVPWVKSLLSQELDIGLTVCRGFLGDQWGKTNAEEMQSWKRD